MTNGSAQIRERDAPADVRTIFLSDIHLGSRGCRAQELLRFLGAHRAQTLYLVGDIIDVESLGQEVYWPAMHNEVLRVLLRLASEGTRIIYIPGNHDVLLRAYCGLRIGNIAVRRAAVHVDALGDRHLVIHGDEFDGIIACSAWLDWLGRGAYRAILRAHGLVNRWRMRLGYGYWPMATVLKHQSKAARRYIGRFREAAISTAAGCGLAGVICGHIHRPEASTHAAILYHNTGDWVEHCSALIEHHDGRLELTGPEKLTNRITAPHRPARIPRAA
jgi:UDP-2,3-diacylglucosamine pyrophosphatase LpxH